jgi:hypothetical protein
LKPVLEDLRPRLSEDDLGGLEWILIELLLNALQVVRRNGQAHTLTAHEVLIEVILSEAGRDFDVRVVNIGKPTQADVIQLDDRFRNYEETRRKTEEQRMQHADSSGRIRIPGALGGGGLALLECIRAAREHGWLFEYFTEEAPVARTVFRVARCSQQSG